MWAFWNFNKCPNGWASPTGKRQSRCVWCDRATTAQSDIRRRMVPLNLRKAEGTIGPEEHDHLSSLGSDRASSQNTQTGVKSGYIYVIRNPAWAGYCKVGQAVDADERLRGYQTSSPWRDYTLAGKWFVQDRRVAERLVHAALARHFISGEWFTEFDTHIPPIITETLRCPNQLPS